MSFDARPSARPVGKDAGVRADNDVAIRVTNLSKCYQIYDKPQYRLLQGLFRGRKQFYKEFWALKDVSFEVKRGETVGIIGRNGSGKSTLLQIICGTLTPTSGTIEINGRIAALLELGAGFSPEFTGRENVYLNGRVLGLSSTEVDDRFDKIAAFADIGEFIDRPVKTYSSGMYVRLAFAVIAHVRAELLVIDEALSVGDAFFQQKCMRFLRRFKEEQGTILFVSHDTSAVSALCNRAIWLSGTETGLLIQDTAESICKAYLSDLYRNRDRDQLEEENQASAPSSPMPSVSNSRTGTTAYRSDHQAENLFTVSPYRGDSESFGLGGARITDASFVDEKGTWHNEVKGGESVTFSVTISVNREIFRPAVGIIIKDRLGQFIFAEGTDRAFRSRQLTYPPQCQVVVIFSFLMPILIQGNYTMDIAVAEGEGDDHVQHHWIHDALILKSISSRLVHGMCGLQNLKMTMRVDERSTND